jgi:hypothetical protein
MPVTVYGSINDNVYFCPRRNTELWAHDGILPKYYDK